MRAEGEPAVVSIHDHELPEKREFDLKDILSALGERAAGWQWWIRATLEAYGTGEELDPQVEAIWVAVEDANRQAQPGGIWLSGREFASFARSIGQTIDGDFQAFPKGLEPHRIALEELRARFPRSRAELVIRILDGCIFEVYTKHAEDIARLRTRFADVRLEDSTHYF